MVCFEWNNIFQYYYYYYYLREALIEDRINNMAFETFYTLFKHFLYDMKNSAVYCSQQLFT
jgi:hypothetical protein